MGIRHAAAAATIAAVMVGLSACIVPPAIPPSQAPAPPPPSPTSTAPAPASTPIPTASAAPTASPTASAAPVVDADGCAPDLQQAIVYVYDPTTFEPAFPAPEILTAYDVACQGRQPSGSDAESFALVPIDQVDPEAVRAQLLAMGLTEDTLAAGFFNFAQPGTGGVAVQTLEERMDIVGATVRYSDETEWIVFTWYEVGTN